MKNTGKHRAWRLLYASCCLIYVGWVASLSSHDFDRILREYRRIGRQMESGRILAAARQELLDECRRQSDMEGGGKNFAANGRRSSGLIGHGAPVDLECRFWPPEAVEAKMVQVSERLQERRHRVVRKLLLFSLLFAVIFLFIPPALIYLLIVGLIKLFRHIRFVR
jgi:hypothetical protein